MEKEMEHIQKEKSMQLLDFVNGKINSYFSLPKNQISTRLSTNQYSFVLQIISTFIEPPIIFLLITIVYLSISGLTKPFIFAMYSVQLGLLIIFNIIKKIIVDRSKATADEAINKRTVKSKVYRGDQQFEELPWGEIQQGDIVFLQQGQSAPADLLLLDSQQVKMREVITYVDMKNVSGQLISQKKKACYLTQIINRNSNQKLYWSRYRNLLSGRLNYEKSTADMRSFNGYLKVSKDPKMEKLSIENLILRQSIIKTSLWVYGLVLYPGMESKIMKNFKEGIKNREPLFSTFDKIFFTFLAFNILFGSIFSIIYSQNGQVLPVEYGTISYHFLMFSFMLPNFIYLGRDLFQILFNLNSLDKQIEVRNYTHLSVLGDINYSMISNIGVLNTGQLFVNEIVTESSIYQLNEEYTSSKSLLYSFKRGSNRQFSKRRYGSSIKQEQFLAIPNRNLLAPICNYDKRNSALLFHEGNNQDNNEEPTFQIDDDMNFRFNEPTNMHTRNSKLTHLEPLKLDKSRFHNGVKKGEKQVIDIMKAISLCHNARFYYNKPKELYQGFSHERSEQVLIKLTKLVGWSVQPILCNKIETGFTITESKQAFDEETGTIKSERGKKNYYLMGVNAFHLQRKLFSVGVLQQQTPILYCKGSPDVMIERLKLSKDKQKIIEQTISSYQNKQSEVILYAKKELSRQQRELYENDYLSLKSSLNITEEQIEDFSKKYENDLQFIAIISLSTQMDPKAENLMQELQCSGIKPCIFTKENSDANTLRKMIMGSQMQWKDVRLEYESIQQIKYYLNEITNILHINPNFIFFLTVTGKAWQTIKYHSEVMQHFLFVSYYSQGMVAVNFGSQGSAELTHKIRHSYPEEQKILGIGSCYTNLKFLGQSNISIGMQSDFPTDIKASCLDSILGALKLGPYFAEVRQAILNLILYKIIKLTAIILIYEIICALYGVSNTINGYIVFFYLVILTCLDLAYHIFYFKTPRKIDEMTSYKNHKNYNESLYFTCLQGISHGIFIILPVYLTLPNVRIQGGKIFPIQAQDMAIFIILCMINIFRNLFSKYHTKLSVLVFGCINGVVMGVCCVIAGAVDKEFFLVVSQTKNLLSAYDSITLIINASLFCLIFSLFLEGIIKKRYFQIKMKEPQKSQKTQRMTEMVRLIKHLYKDEDSMEESMKEIVGKDMNVNQLKINNYLEIKDEEDDIKFNFHRVPVVRNNFLKVMVIQILYMIAILIADSLTSSEGFVAYKSMLILVIFVTIISMLIFSRCELKSQINMNYYKVVYILSIINVGLYLGFVLTKNDSSSFLLISYISIILTQSVAIKYPILVFLMAVSCLLSVMLAFILNNNYTEIALRSILLIVCYLINMAMIYRSELDSKLNFVVNEAFGKQANYIDDILSILVPKFIKNHLEQNQFALQEEQKNVSILFCYVCNFDQIVTEEGKHVVPLMDELFRQFDHICHNYAVQKIETVGQTYMAATGVTPYENQIESEMKKKNQVERLFKMAIQMLEKSNNIMWGTKKNKKLNIKIGIHHGNVVIGVIGCHKPQFSLIGDTVNTTSRHCSTAQPGQIVLSEVAFKVLKKYPASHFEIKTRKMKGLGTVPVYAYRNGEVKQNFTNQRIILKFQRCVRMVIEDLRRKGELGRNNMGARELAQRFFVERRNTIRQTRISEGRKSIGYETVHLDQEDSKQNKYSELELKYNSFLELTEKSSEFYRYLITKNAYYDKTIFCVLTTIYIFLLVFDVIVSNYNTTSLIIESVGVLLFPISFILYKKAIKNKYVNILYLVFQCLLTVCVFIREIITENSNYQSLDYLWNIIQVTICSSQVAFRFIHTVVLSVVSLIMACIGMGLKGKFEISIIVLFFYFTLNCYRKYKNLQETYKNYSSAKIHKKKSQQQSDLVSQLLPKHAYEKLKNQNSENRLELTDRFEKVTMLFADIKGFTSFSNQTTPVGVVKMLRELFQKFDQLCLKYNVYKVYTIGDCYVVLGFTNCYQRNYHQQAKNVVNMGLAMIETIQKVRQDLNFSELDMRIGIHTGTIIGGIIGTEIVRYDIYGPDVMVANKFEQFGKIGAIHISQATKEILEEDNKCFTITQTVEKTVKVEKLNAEYNGYILCKKKFEI